MWDSLESIWLAARQDPDCDAYCVPIPYFELNSDGTLGTMHYEGAGFYGDDVEVTHWLNYDIAARHPDVIFIHYAYDHMVRNATVHPDFYSKELKDHCECLIYVHYFVAPDNKVEDYYGYLPGVLNADYVMLQSEEVRQSYISQYKKFCKANPAQPSYGRAEDKFVAIGSPKYDKAIHARPEDHEIPPEWQRLLYKDNGEKKKIIFYNTHVFKWVNGGKAYFRKLSSVFEAFRNREDVVLWWRPHPNTELNFRIFRPDLLGEYASTIEAYKQEAWGIYDDSPDLHRAIAWSDAYYGDGSSVTELFKAAGKPIYYQNTEITEEHPAELLEQFPFHVADMFEAGGQLYAVTLSEHLFRLAGDRLTYDSQIELEAGAPRNRNFYSKLVIQDQVVFIPHNCNEMVVYHPATREYNRYPLELRQELMAPVNGSNRNFFHGIPYQNRIFLVPCGYRGIVAFDLDTKETEHCLDLSGMFPQGRTHSLFHGWTWLNENTVLLASLYTNEVLEFCLDTREYKVHTVGSKQMSYQCIFKYGDCFFLIARQGFLLKWNHETGEVTAYDKLPKGFKVTRKQDWVFLVNNLKPYKNKLILIGGFTNMVLEFDLDTCEYRKMEEFDAILNRSPNAEQYADYSFSTCNYLSDKFFYFAHKNDVLYRYDFETRAIEPVCEIRPEWTSEYCSAMNQSFIDRMAKGQSPHVSANDRDKLRDGQAGARIYKHARDRVLKNALPRRI